MHESAIMLAIMRGPQNILYETR